MAGKVTLKEIAREAGLSIATVSLVLNNRPCRVSEENRRRIKEIARAKHYVPNQIARSLVTQRSGTLGLIVPNIESRLFAPPVAQPRAALPRAGLRAVHHHLRRPRRA